MQIWPKRYTMARVLSLGLFLVLVYNQSNERFVIVRRNGSKKTS
jgi:hypothetical protein